MPRTQKQKQKHKVFSLSQHATPIAGIAQGQHEEQDGYYGQASFPGGRGFITRQLPSQADNKYQGRAMNHSYVSAMDLITTTASTASNHAKMTFGTFQPLQSQLFSSSSHHTSHAAAAGDLLTMNRRALDPQQPVGQGNGIIKRRLEDNEDGSVSVGQPQNLEGGMERQMVEVANCQNADQSTFLGMDRNNSQSTGQRASAIAGQHHAPQHIEVFRDSQGKAFFHDKASPKDPETPLFGVLAKTSSKVGAAGDRAYQHHRTIRRCRRSDSFEMMTDG